jgi:hypothetical protein
MLMKKHFRIAVRAINSTLVLGLSFIGVDVLKDTSWLGLIVAVMSLGCIVELIGRQKLNLKFSV